MCRGPGVGVGVDAGSGVDGEDDGAGAGGRGAIGSLETHSDVVSSYPVSSRVTYLQTATGVPCGICTEHTSGSGGVDCAK